MRDAHETEVVASIFAFLDSIGIPVEPGDVDEATFVPGILVDCGRLRVDLARLAYPGDLLHEAGHIAVMAPSCRAVARGDAGQDLGAEIAAELWSWAAVTHLDLPPELVFHPAGYKGASAWLIETYSAGHYPGLPLLQWMGLTLDAANAEARGLPAFPHMLRWLREREA